MTASRLRVDSVDQGLAVAANSDSQLLLLVSPQSTRLKRAALALAAQMSWRSVFLNIELAQRLLPLGARERRELGWAALEDVVRPDAGGVVLSGTDILFEPSLEFRPYEALRRLGRRGRVVATWCGAVESHELVRAMPGHPEYLRVRFDVPYIDVVTNGG